MSDVFENGWLFAGGAALATLVATCWSHLKNFYQQVASRVIVTITVSGYEADAVLMYLKSRFEASRWGPRAYVGWMLYVQPRRRVQLVPMEIAAPAGRMYWHGWRPLWTFQSRSPADDLECGVSTREYTSESLSLAFLRGTFDADRLIVEATGWFNEQVVTNAESGGRRHSIRHVYGTAGRAAMHAQHGTPQVSRPSSSTDLRGCMQYRSLAWSFAELGPERSCDGTAFDHLALTPAVRQLVDEGRHWKVSEEWYKSRGIPWRRGWLLHGRPGTGKTALARAMAEDLDLPVFVYDLASLHNNELQQHWAEMLAEVPCMALIEDLDAVFEKRKNVSARDRQTLTFDCLLNCLDGIERADGLFVVITTNRLDKIDAALGVPDGEAGSTRPGRIDRVLELNELEEAGRRKLASRILEEWPGEWEPLVVAGAGDTGAQFQERCARRALELHYAERDGARGTASVAGLRAAAASAVHSE